MDAIEQAMATLKRDEGYREHMYECSRGFTTIGYGTNLDDGLDREEAEAVMAVRVKRNYKRMVAIGLGNIHPEAMAVCLNISYQLGFRGFLKFRKTIAYLHSGQYRKASFEMLDSAWAVQTPHRAKRLSLRVRALEEA